jgi:hypothetical protein
VRNGYRHGEEVPTMGVKVIGLDTAKNVFKYIALMHQKAVMRRR